MNDNGPTEPAPAAAVRRLLAGEPDPGFAAQLRSDLRGRHARQTHSLHWFDLDLPVGRIRLVHDGELVHMVTNALDAFDAVADRVVGYEPSFGESARVERGVTAVFEGKRRGCDVAYLGDLPAFQRAVLRATATIPKGEVRPYGWVARHAGSAAAVRATGTALGHNPVPFVVPCHRVVRSDWHLGQYSAGGADVKGRVLRWEGFDPDALAPLAASHLKFVADEHSGMFCLPTCGGIFADADLLRFPTSAAAAAAGFAPCDHCQPA